MEAFAEVDTLGFLPHISDNVDAFRAVFCFGTPSAASDVVSFGIFEGLSIRC